MTWWEAIILGLVQGLTEFLPISSSAHLRVIGELLPGGADPGAAFTAITQIGTETAVLLYFRRDIARIVTAWWKALTGRDGQDWRARTGAQDADARMGWWIIIGTLPIVVLGLGFEDSIKGPFRDLRLIVVTLVVFAMILGYLDRTGAKKRTLAELTGRQAVGFGFAQALALIPGVSRSGGTISAGLYMGYTREAAARYSFLLAIPAVLGSGLQQLVKSVHEFGQAGMPSLGVTILATLIAFIVGYVVIIGFLKIVSTYSYMPFVRYRYGFAAVIVLLLLVGALHPMGAAS